MSDKFPKKQIKQQVLDDFEQSGKDQIVLMNNVPLVVIDDQLQLDYQAWEELPLKSLQLVCEIAKEVKAMGNQASLIFFADDHTYGHPQASWYQTLRKNFFTKYNSHSTQLPSVVDELFSKNDLSIQDIITCDHAKRGRENCLYFSEVSLRFQRQEIENPCARELIQVFSDDRYFRSERDHLVLPILSMCERGVCHSALPLLNRELSNFTETTIVFDYDRDLNLFNGVFS